MNQEFVMNQERMNALLEQALCGLMYCAADPYLTILYANQAVYQLIGYSRKEFAEQFHNRLIELIFEDSLPSDCGLFTPEAQQAVDLELSIRRRDGSFFQALLHCVRTPDGIWCISLTDITNIKDLEHERREGEKQLQTIIDNIIGGVGLFELDGDCIKTVYTSGGFRSITGYREDGIGSSSDVLKNMVPEDREKSLILAQKSALTGEPFELIYRANRANSTVQYLQLRALRIPYEQSPNPVFLALIVDITPQKAAEQKLSEALQQRQLLLDTVPIGLVVFNLTDQFRFLYRNEGILRMSGYEIDEFDAIMQQDPGLIFLKEDMNGFFLEAQAAFRENRYLEYTCRLIHKSGEERSLWIRGRQLQKDGTTSPVFYAFLLDITHQKQMEMELKMQGERYRILEETTQDILFDYNCATDTILFSLKSSAGEVQHLAIQNYWSSLGETDLIHPDCLTEFKRSMLQMMLAPIKGQLEYQARFVNNTPFNWYRCHYSSIADSRNKVVNIVGRIVNIQGEIEQKQIMLERANSDPMTGLLNKMAVLESVRPYLANRGPAAQHAMLIFDVDDFKSVNDRNGHAYGDIILKRIAHCLASAFSGQILSRYGGDEFLAFLPNTTEEKTLDCVHTFFHSLAALEGSPSGLPITCSVGIAFAEGEESLPFLELFHRADTAMYQAKRSGKKQYVIFRQK